MRVVEEYTAPSGNQICLATDGKRWQTSCWTKEGECHWSLDFDTEELARKEFERWRR